MRRRLDYMHWLVAVVIAATVAACANMGTIEGGPRDVTPPVFLRSEPQPSATKVDNQRIDLFFDENVQLKDVSSKVVVSPAQSQMPVITANGKRVTVELKDSLIPNTTYTIDFADAIADLNEGNIYDGFAMDFATGDSIDSLRISGMVFEARNLEPAQNMLVGVHSNLDDSALTTLPLVRIAKTNQLGQFTVRGLKPGNYRVFAINDVNRDYKWDRSEDVAFYDVTVSPKVNNITVTDTLLDSEGKDSIDVHPGVEYLPNDILMTWFNQGYKAQYMASHARPDSAKITIEMAAPSDSLPVLTIIDGDRRTVIDETVSRLQASMTLDTLTYWITDPAIYSRDSLLIETRYLKTDTNDNLSWTNDTIYYNFRRPKQKKEKKKKDDNTDGTDSVPKIELLDISLKSISPQDVNRPLRFSVPVPLAGLDSTAFHLDMKQDSLWIPVTDLKFVPDTIYHPLDYKAEYAWVPGETYRLTIDSLAVTSIYGRWNKQITKEINVRPLEDYSSLIFNIPDTVGAPIIVELLASGDKVAGVAPVIGGKAVLPFLQPGTYYARAFIDRDSDGLWTTGDIASWRQPEDVFYYPKKINLKKNWDLEQTWNLFELPVDIQKPLEIKKNKPKKKDDDEKKNDDDDEEEDDWNTNFMPGSRYNDDFNRQRNRNRF